MSSRLRQLFRACLVVCALGTAGCVHGQYHRPPACSVVETTPDGAPRITLFYATDRVPDDGPASAGFGSHRSHIMSYGRLEIRLPFDHERQAGEISGYRITKTARFSNALQFSDALRLAEHRHGSGTSPDALVMVHGFHETFERFAFRASQMVYDGCYDVVPVMFSWPSRDSVWSYFYDFNSAIFARDHLASLLRLVGDASGPRRTNIFAHSIGGFIALEAVSKLHWTSRDPALETIILASPDVDIDIFRQDAPNALAAARHLALLTSSRDPLLRLSGYVAGGVPRAGAASEQDLSDHHVRSLRGLTIVRIDGPEITNCVGGLHRCAETHQPILLKIRKLLAGRSDPETPPASQAGESH